jgi:lysophospholipase L1-like esterase
MLFEKNRKIVFIGDSITDAGRRDVAVPYGNGYVAQLRTMLLARYPDLNLTVINRGISGNTVRDLNARWETDAIALQPHYLSVCVGINDVWRQFSGPKAEAVFPDEYQTTLRKLIGRAKQAGISKILLASPYMIEWDKNKPIRQQIGKYGEIMAGIANEFGAVYINLQAAFDQALKTTPPTTWSNDQFHPNTPGVGLIANAFLKAINFQL